MRCGVNARVSEYPKWIMPAGSSVCACNRQRVDKEAEGSGSALDERGLRVAPRVPDIDDEWYPAVVQHGLWPFSE